MPYSINEMPVDVAPEAIDQSSLQLMRSRLAETWHEGMLLHRTVSFIYNIAELKFAV